jgi:DNA-binding transcriptional MerR regulator
MQIGEVAERTGLSLRTIRYYEEVGLVIPSARTPGGFRLYTEPDVARLELIMRMKPLGFQLDEMRRLLAVLHPGPSTSEHKRGTPDSMSPEQRDTLREFTATAERRCADLRRKLEVAEDFATTLRERLARS